MYTANTMATAIGKLWILLVHFRVMESICMIRLMRRRGKRLRNTLVQGLGLAEACTQLTLWLRLLRPSECHYHSHPLHLPTQKKRQMNAAQQENTSNSFSKKISNPLIS